MVSGIPIRSSGGVILRGKIEVLGEKSGPVPLCPTPIPPGSEPETSTV